MKRASVIVLAMAGILAGCTAGPAPSPTTGTSATPVPVAGSECPAGTNPRDDLCLADDPLADDLSRILHTQFTDAQLKATIAGVWHNGDPVLIGALGESMTGVPATPDMHHLLGNLSTPMFTTVVLQQVQAGRLSLDDPLSDWFPDLPASEQVTIDMLLHNTSGYPHYTEIPAFLDRLWADPFQQWPIQDLVDIGVAGGPVFTPGTDWLFSDTNTLILQQVVEEVSGRPVGELLREGVFDALGMDDSTAAFDADWPSPVLHGYSDERGVWEDVTNWSPTWTYTAGGVGADQADVAVFLDALGEGTLLSPELHDLQFAPSTAGLGRFTDQQYWAMGFLQLDGWMFLNPGLSGYFGAGGTFPEEGWTMVVYTTTSQDGDQSAPTATDIFRQFTAVVTPEHSLVQ
ncbi:serine hydrolase domain-containing protein [Microbacterium pygmaeum]|uniref:D-alanyl-D-alanine carboxypeptidase n=1 Tax=Microbacterium pygmaeum TaxID=370764 RepID=A0A1G7U735_9MICO|nr:serine hydrolase domain-containing protein [Microbacterium pygmaeum]SDG43386.1 D-alanyl-D-alanine carboxypeptidase [Microbacterium pygmaeum]